MKSTLGARVDGNAKALTNRPPGTGMRSKCGRRAWEDSLSACQPGGHGIGAARTSHRNVGVYWWAQSPSTNARAAATGQRKGPAA